MGLFKKKKVKTVSPPNSPNWASYLCASSINCRDNRTGEVQIFKATAPYGLSIAVDNNCIGIKQLSSTDKDGAYYMMAYLTNHSVIQITWERNIFNDDGLFVRKSEDPLLKFNADD